MINSIENLNSSESSENDIETLSNEEDTETTYG